MADGPQSTAVTLSQTCQTCFQAKIRCEKTQDSELCDRCLRLGKTCLYSPARRRRNNDRQRVNKKFEVRSQTSRSPSANPASSTPGQDGALDPFLSKLISPVDADALLQYYSSKMTLHFPFVFLPPDTSATDLYSNRPCLSLAVFAAASHNNVAVQQKIGSMLNRLIASRLIEGDFADLDLLQGLLVHLAWAQYQPRPKRYTQHLNLATSIISDMRLDRPRKPEVWEVQGCKDKSELDWRPEEMRALLGVYYLTSSSSVLLQKSRNFFYKPYISECCQRLAQVDEHITDKYLFYLVEMVRLAEDIEVTATEPPVDEVVRDELWHGASDNFRRRFSELKTAMPFSLSENLPIQLHFHMLELILSQSSPRGSSFGLRRFHTDELSSENEASLNAWLSSSVTAVKSLINVVVALPKGEEAAFSNIEWIMLYCGMSLAARLDLTLASAQTFVSTQHLRNFLDISHVLRQLVLRLESTAAASPAGPGTSDDNNPFQGLAKRAKKLEKWHQGKLDEHAASLQQSAPHLEHTDATGNNFPAGNGGGQMPMPLGELNWQHSPELDMTGVLFSDLLNFPSSFMHWAPN